MKLKGKNVVISGAGRGIGAAIATLFTAEGARVYALDNHPAQDSAAIQCDVKSEHDIQQTAHQILSECNNSIHILVNNAGINPTPASIIDTAVDDWDRILENNLKGIFLLSKTLIPYMPDGGSIINIASILGIRGGHSCSAYSASKGGIITLTQSMAKDFAPRLRVNAISPGAIETDMFDEYLQRTKNSQLERKRITDEIPLQRLGEPRDVAKAALFLASSDAAWITGHNLVVDGGDSM